MACRINGSYSELDGGDDDDDDGGDVEEGGCQVLLLAPGGDDGANDDDAGAGRAPEAWAARTIPHAARSFPVPPGFIDSIFT
jgi:hypothetical protein